MTYEFPHSYYPPGVTGNELVFEGDEDSGVVCPACGGQATSATPRPGVIYYYCRLCSWTWEEPDDYSAA